MATLKKFPNKRRAKTKKKKLVLISPKSMHYTITIH